MTKSNFISVCEFNTSFGLPHSNTPQINILKQNTKISDLRINLCKEEAEEYNDAFRDKNFIEIIDALTDELYVLYGAGSSFGVNLDNLFVSKIIAIYFQSSYKKEHNDNEFLDEILAYSNYDMLKNILIKKEPLFTYRRCNTINSDTIFSDRFVNSKEYENLRVTLFELKNNLNRNIKKLEQEKQLGHFEGVVDTLATLLHDTYKLGIFQGINLDTSFKIVHSSNMSKLCRSEKEAEETVEWYKLNDDRYKTPHYRKSDDGKYWVVYNKDSGKILKSILYTPADFKTLFTP